MNGSKRDCLLCGLILRGLIISDPLMFHILSWASTIVGRLHFLTNSLLHLQLAFEVMTSPTLRKNNCTCPYDVWGSWCKIGSMLQNACCVVTLLKRREISEGSKWGLFFEMRLSLSPLHRAILLLGAVWLDNWDTSWHKLLWTPQTYLQLSWNVELDHPQ